jgi:AcrR family transcriptional regulator
MVVIEKSAPRRCRGRPQVRSDEETHALILEAAGQEFQANGYEATSIADVAERAGVSTKTLYRLIPTKADLFADVIADRIGRFVLEYDLSRLDCLDAAAALERMLTVFGTLTLEPRTVALTRLVIGESRAFPEVGAAFYENAILRTSQAMEDGLRRLCARGLIALNDPREAVSMLRGMMIMEPQRAAMLGQREPPGPEEIAARAKRCAQIFLNGCAVDLGSTPTGLDNRNTT